MSEELIQTYKQLKYLINYQEKSLNKDQKLLITTNKTVVSEISYLEPNLLILSGIDRETLEPAQDAVHYANLQIHLEIVLAKQGDQSKMPNRIGFLGSAQID
ncbi:hypothetical protein [Peptoniphilus genitalis]|uniref:hypothetical protein n=1 Tax=Peptoniphilus genitalis TaxID=3036303 RepID=UPI0024AD34D2|nr:hypothetical protein [Peptoniphilus sp. Marseille-Q7072]